MTAARTVANAITPNANRRGVRHFASPHEAQITASDPRACVWVNASAGSGKTTVLTRRVTRLLLDGTPPERLLCLTFTRAGAAEMTNRITELFSKWVGCSEDELRADLDQFQGCAPTPDQLTEARRLFARVLSCPGGLRIRTIHSFCQEILSRFPIEAGLPPHFGLIEGQELDSLRAETLNDLLREAADAPDSQLAADLALMVAEIGEGQFEENLFKALRICSSLDTSPDEIVANLRAQFDLQPGETTAALKQRAMAEIPEGDLRALAAQLVQEERPSFQSYGRLILQQLERPLNARVAGFDAYYDIFLTGDLVFRKRLVSKNMTDHHPALVDLATAEATRLLLTLERIEAVETVDLTAAILRFGTSFARRLADRKTARAALDYDDLIRLTERLLMRPGVNAWILYKLDRGIDHVLVDEAQDTSRAQWNIVRALTSEFFETEAAQDDRARTVFVVGDEKQSIFSFQNADPEGFLTNRDFFAQRLAASGRELIEIGQHTSFRSARAILDATDATFAPDEARRGVSQDPVKHATPSDRKPRLGRVEVWPLIEADKDKQDDGWFVPTTYETTRDPQVDLAERIAARIRKWLDSRFILPGTNDPVRPADIMILLRRRGRFADIMVRALKSLNVPVTGIDRMHLVKELPVLDLLAAVRFVLLPEDDLTLAALLRSPLIGLSEDDLMRLAIGRGERSLWQSLNDKAQDDPRFSTARAWLAARQAEADFSTPFAFLSRLLALPCPADSESGRRALWQRLGAESLDPIDELINAAQSFSRAHPPSLQNFLRWLTEGDTEIKRELDNGKKPGEDEGLVRIMTVHASKGLEAPIVFLPDTASLPQSRDVPKVLTTPDGTPIYIARKPKLSQPLAAIWSEARRAQLEEYRRLLYVAMTRAANRLYICGWKPKKNDSNDAQNWYNLMLSALKPLHQEHAEVEHGGDLSPLCVLADHPLAPDARAPKDDTAKPVTAALPAWARQTAAHANRGERPAPPSASIEDETAAATPDIAFARGRVIHRLLQSLPDIAPARRREAIDRFLSQPRHNLNDGQQSEIAREVERLLSDPAFAALFGADSRAEVALTGLLNGVEAFRQVDRLCLRGDEVWIVDYKTNRPPPANAGDVPDVYKVQVGEYRALLRGIYPDKRVRCFLLWTYAPRLMELTPSEH